MRSALRHLCNQGIEALKAQKVETKAVQIGEYVAKPSKMVWRKPMVSKRVANDLRKAAIRDGTYGSFNTETGVGWDPLWDFALKPNRFNVSQFGGVKPPKKTKRERNREERAKKIEENLETRLEKMDEYYTEKEQARIQDKGFEAHYKRMMRGGAPHS
eukprot:Nitzschia sp. Nitz4//scaffold167_size49223//34706//35179//NITZ4_007039-RA/size49223-processed-gene-0.61-mRNA-1//-1//CDS//3329538287//5831//frame0